MSSARRSILLRLAAQEPVLQDPEVSGAGDGLVGRLPGPRVVDLVLLQGNYQDAKNELAATELLTEQLAKNDLLQAAAAR